MVKIKDHLLYLSDVLDGMGLLESHMNKISTKVDKIDKMAGRLEAMSVHELMVRDEALEDKATTVVGFEREDSSLGSIAQMKECIKGLDSAQQAIEIV